MKEAETIASIDKEMADLAERRQKLLAKSRDEELEKAKAVIKTYGFTAAELEIEFIEVKPIKIARKARAANGTAKTVVKKSPPKYANPTNPDITWAGGKGPKPKWVQEHLKAGKPLDDLLIQ
jgi:DNA-binding protein H-NS